jgi:regulator of RNase E activity RraA
MVIPSEITNEVVEECTEMTLFEDFVLEQVNKGQSIIGLYPPTNENTLDEFEAWKKSHNSN